MYSVLHLGVVIVVVNLDAEWSDKVTCIRYKVIDTTDLRVSHGRAVDQAYEENHSDRSYLQHTEPIYPFIYRPVTGIVHHGQCAKWKASESSPVAEFAASISESSLMTQLLMQFAPRSNKKTRLLSYNISLVLGSTRQERYFACTGAPGCVKYSRGWVLECSRVVEPARRGQALSSHHSNPDKQKSYGGVVVAVVAT